jgi:hypothetical protein
VISTKPIIWTACCSWTECGRSSRSRSWKNTGGSGPRTPNDHDDLSDDERASVAPYFTNTDRPVFALVNLPETVKGALFARYSRSPKSLRRLFLDEFYEGAGGGAGGDRWREDRSRRSVVSTRL